MEVILTADVWARMKAYVDLCPDEISGLGKVEKDGNNYRIVDIALFKQTVSPAHSDISAQSLAEFQVELIKRGESLEDWNFWWHSHAKMPVFFSGTDTGTIDSSTEFKYLVSLVTNHKHEFCARVDVYEHARLYKALDVSIEEPENEAVIEACQADIDAKVSRPSAIYTPRTGFQRRDGFENGYQGTIYDEDEEETDIIYGTGYRKPLITPRKVVIEDYEALDEALTKIGTEDFAVAIETYEEMVGDLETEIDYLKTGNDKKALKAKEKELKKLLAIGEEHGIDAYGV